MAQQLRILASPSAEQLIEFRAGVGAAAAEIIAERSEGIL